MHGFSIQLQDFIACFEREKIVILLDCTVSYVIHALKRSLANAKMDAGVKVTYGSFQLQSVFQCRFLGSGKRERRGIPTFL